MSNKTSGVLVVEDLTSNISGICYFTIRTGNSVDFGDMQLGGNAVSI